MGGAARRRLSQFGSFWPQYVSRRNGRPGGGAAVWPPRSAGTAAALRVFARLPHLAIPYARNGLLGLYAAAIELLASNVNARIIKNESTEPTRLFVLRVDWD